MATAHQYSERSAATRFAVLISPDRVCGVEGTPPRLWTTFRTTYGIQVLADWHHHRLLFVSGGPSAGYWLHVVRSRRVFRVEPNDEDTAALLKQARLAAASEAGWRGR
ncbi:MAG: hypothetical protein HC841_03480 [Verrucomicrobiae bacterium]|nr:hypothetical protein [Verrucomicrobiae bacterium]